MDKPEIVNKCLEGYLCCFVSDKQTQWFKWLPLAEWWYNTSFHTATKMTPFMALYGYHPPSITSSLKEKSKVQVVEDHIEHQQQVLQILKDNLTMAHNHMKQQADQHRSERSFEVGDWVFLRLQPYKQMSLKQAKKDNKLSPKYYGPYKVLQNIGTMAYKLELPASSRVHLVFHVSCLKKVIGVDILPPMPKTPNKPMFPPIMILSLTTELKLSTNKSKRTLKNNNHPPSISLLPSYPSFTDPFLIHTFIVLSDY
jgi:hypothetical protein